MESKWGREVFDQGLIDIGASLASRLSLFPPRYFLTNAPANPGFCIVAVLPAETPIYYQIGQMVKRVQGTNFPYGWDVDPNVPL